MARIDAEIQRAVAKIIGEDVKDPRMGFVTVTRVAISSDMMTCKVFVSIIGDRHVARQSMDALESATRFIRGELGAIVKLRHTPELTFVEDRSTERAIELSKTLARAAVSDE
jgi:ribosome-binding factor A